MFEIEDDFETGISRTQRHLHDLHAKERISGLITTQLSPQHNFNLCVITIQLSPQHNSNLCVITIQLSPQNNSNFCVITIQLSPKITSICVCVTFRCGIRRAHRVAAPTRHCGHFRPRLALLAPRRRSPLGRRARSRRAANRRRCVAQSPPRLPGNAEEAPGQVWLHFQGEIDQSKCLLWLVWGEEIELSELFRASQSRIGKRKSTRQTRPTAKLTALQSCFATLCNWQTIHHLVSFKVYFERCLNLFLTYFNSLIDHFSHILIVLIYCFSHVHCFSHCR